MVTFILSVSAFSATGGACPSGANYPNAAGTFVALSNSYYGITSCFYASTSTGSDSLYDGTSETISGSHGPWAHIPGMASCASHCAANVPAPGNGYILRGGDTWGQADLGIDWSYLWSGNSTNRVYVGVDLAWDNSSVCTSGWCRPIFNCGRATCNGGEYAGNNYLHIINPTYVVFDDIEMKGLYVPDNNNYSFVIVASTYIEIERMYIHGWSHASGITNDGLFGINFGNGQAVTGDVAHDNVIDGSDSSEDMMQWGIGSSVPLAYNNYVSYAVSNYLGTFNIFHDNVAGPNVLSCCGDHANGVNIFGPVSVPGTLLAYNNLISGALVSGSVKFWLIGNEKCSGCTTYAFNNVMYNVDASNVVPLGEHPASAPYGTFYIFNNTLECGTDSSQSQCTGNGEAQTGSTAKLYNNHFMSSVSPGCNSTGIACNEVNDLLWSVATANSQGYNSSQTYAFSPTASKSPTVGAGTSGTTMQALCTTISGIYAGAGTACQSDTTYAVGYNTANHTVTSPARTTIARPASAAWDIGAYQYNNAQSPPTGLTAVVH